MASTTELKIYLKAQPLPKPLKCAHFPAICQNLFWTQSSAGPGK